MSPMQKSKSSEENVQWYLHSPVFNLAGGRSIARPNAEFWFKEFWKRCEQSAFAYELLRGVAHLDVTWLSKTDRKAIQGLPPYPDLALEDQKLLQTLFSIPEKPCRTEETTRSQPWTMGKPRLKWDYVREVNGKESDKTRRRRAREAAKRYWPLIQAFLFRQRQQPAHPAGFKIPKIEHRLAGCLFTPEQVVNAVQSARKSTGSTP